jgi:hypothetical protein
MPPQLGLSTQLVPQGDTTLVGLTINYGYSSFTMAISQQAAIQLANALPKMLAEVVNEAKRAQYGGLVIASPDQLRTLPPINGHGRPA